MTAGMYPEGDLAQFLITLRWTVTSVILFTKPHRQDGCPIACHTPTHRHFHLPISNILASLLGYQASACLLLNYSSPHMGKKLASLVASTSVSQASGINVWRWRGLVLQRRPWQQNEKTLMMKKGTYFSVPRPAMPVEWFSTLLLNLIVYCENVTDWWWLVFRYGQTAKSSGKRCDSL